LRGIDTLSGWIEEDIESGDLDGARQRLETLRGRSRRLETLLDSVVDYTREDASLRDGAGETADGEALMQDINELVDPPPGFTLRFADAFGAVQLPRIAAQRVFCNLIGNSIKHHDRDVGVIGVSVADAGPNYLFTIEDDGPGIAAEDQARVFELFQTLKPRDAREGSGLGLPIVRKILALVGGEITLEQRGGGRGAAFRFTWPKSSLTVAAERLSHETSGSRSFG
jgi:signal transduction histidine kinase